MYHRELQLTTSLENGVVAHNLLTRQAFFLFLFVYEQLVKMFFHNTDLIYMDWLQNHRVLFSRKSDRSDLKMDVFPALWSVADVRVST
jgi:hypothetical protein